MKPTSTVRKRVELKPQKTQTQFAEIPSFQSPVFPDLHTHSLPAGQAQESFDWLTHSILSGNQIEDLISAARRFSEFCSQPPLVSDVQQDQLLNAEAKLELQLEVERRDRSSGCGQQHTGFITSGLTPSKLKSAGKHFVDAQDTFRGAMGTSHALPDSIAPKSPCQAAGNDKLDPVSSTLSQNGHQQTLTTLMKTSTTPPEGVQKHLIHPE